MTLTPEQITSILTEFANEKGINHILELSLNAIMLSERAIYLSSGKDQGNGFRTVKSPGSGQELVLKVPRSRKGGFFPMILGLMREEDSEKNKLVTSLYTRGLTTEAISEVWEEMYGKSYSKSQISQLMVQSKQEIGLWLERRLDKRYLALFIDATFVHTRRDQQVSKEAYYTVLGMREDGRREVLSVVNHPTEGATNWLHVFQELKSRGLAEVDLVVSDGLTGIENAVAQGFPAALHQLCVVHLKRNIQSVFPMKIRKDIGEELKSIFPMGTETIKPMDAFAKYKAFIEKYEKKYPSLKSYKSDRYIHYFTYLLYSAEVQRMIYSTNWIERLNRDHKKVLKMRGALPNPEAVLFLMGSVAQQKTEKTYTYPISAFIGMRRLSNT